MLTLALWLCGPTFAETLCYPSGFKVGLRQRGGRPVVGLSLVPRPAALTRRGLRDRVEELRDRTAELREEDQTQAVLARAEGLAPELLVRLDARWIDILAATDRSAARATVAQCAEGDVTTVIGDPAVVGPALTVAHLPFEAWTRR